MKNQFKPQFAIRYVPTGAYYDGYGFDDGACRPRIYKTKAAAASVAHNYCKEPGAIRRAHVVDDMEVVEFEIVVRLTHPLHSK